jgi:hypothetical protein
MKPTHPVDPLGRSALLACCLTVFLAASGIHADDVTDADSILCTAMRVHECTASGGCQGGLPWDYNLPTFVEIDLRNQEMRTTEASGENRSTPIKNLEREDGFVYLQGVENGRAFSAVIATEPGLATFSIAADGLSLVVFGACTPVFPSS